MSFYQDSQSKRKYSRISMKKRENLVSMVLENDQTIACAARRLGLKPSTARMIINKYKKTGTYPMKNFKKPVRGPSQKIKFVKEEANDEGYRILGQENHQQGESVKQQVQQPMMIPQYPDQWAHFLMMNPYSTLYLPPGLSYP